ncbi:MAG: hypothetical protein IJA76_04180 [Clostridia bacterium]|nr:hypothetical protein [Clostridia bacterium]
MDNLLKDINNLDGVQGENVEEQQNVVVEPSVQSIAPTQNIIEPTSEEAAPSVLEEVKTLEEVEASGLTDTLEQVEEVVPGTVEEPRVALEDIEEPPVALEDIEEPHVALEDIEEVAAPVKAEEPVSHPVPDIGTVGYRDGKPSPIVAADFTGQKKLVTVIRKKALAGTFANFKVYIDGVCVGELKSGQHQTFWLDFEAHELTIWLAPDEFTDPVIIPIGAKPRTYVVSLSGVLDGTASVSVTEEKPE